MSNGYYLIYEWNEGNIFYTVFKLFSNVVLNFFVEVEFAILLILTALLILSEMFYIIKLFI